MKKKVFGLSIKKVFVFIFAILSLFTLFGCTNTKTNINVDGIEIKVNDNATITYKVAFYDEDKEFIEMSSALDEDFDIADLPEGAEYFKVVITPNQVDGEDVKITILNVAHYANMLKITYNK